MNCNSIEIKMFIIKLLDLFYSVVCDLFLLLDEYNTLKTKSMKSKIATLILLLLPVCCSAQSLEEVDIVSDGLSRKFWVQLPDDPGNLNDNLPVIIVLHGDGGTGSGIASYSGIANLAATHNFIGVFPNAYTGGWNRAVLGDSPADDLLFMQDIINYLCVNYSINRNRVYATGHSAGGFLAYRMAIEMADQIAAIAPVAASMYGDAGNNGDTYINNYLGSSGFIKIPILHIHGDNDNTVAYPDPNHQPDAWSEYPLTGFSYPTCGENTYNPANVTDINGSVKKIMFCSTGMNAKEISLIRIVGGGHGWPSVQLPDVATRIVQFLMAFELEGQPVCQGLGLNSTNATSFKLVPNPAKDVVHIQTDEPLTSVRLYEPTGKWVKDADPHSGMLSIVGLNAGVYLLMVETETGTSIQKLVKE